ncbi:MAG: peptidoglycan-binding protein [Oligoflexales bacterium]|nr:peptidoglycan-binding protein [Oligoflexales bacterium]
MKIRYFISSIVFALAIHQFPAFADDVPNDQERFIRDIDISADAGGKVFRANQGFKMLKVRWESVDSIEPFEIATSVDGVKWTEWQPMQIESEISAQGTHFITASYETANQERHFFYRLRSRLNQQFDYLRVFFDISNIDGDQEPTYGFYDQCKISFEGQILKRGSRGRLVSELQTALHDVGYFFDTIDGIYGQKTEAAVRSFQSNHNLNKVDGIAGPETERELSNFLSLVHEYCQPH